MNTFSHPFSSLLIPKSRTDIYVNRSSFLQTPITTLVDASILLVFSMSCPSGRESPEYARLVLLCLPFYSQSRIDINHTPSLFVDYRSPHVPTSVSYSSCSVFLSLLALHHKYWYVWSCFFCSLPSQSYINGNHNHSPGAVVSHQLSFGPPCPARYHLGVLFIRLCTCSISLCLLFCSQNHAMTSSLIAPPFCRLPSALLSTTASCSSSSRCLVLIALHYIFTHVWSFFPRSFALQSYIDIYPEISPFCAKSAPFDLLILSVHFVSCLSGYALQIPARLVLLCLLFCPRNLTMTSILSPHPFCRLPPSLLSISVSSSSFGVSCPARFETPIQVRFVRLSLLFCSDSHA